MKLKLRNLHRYRTTVYIATSVAALVTSILIFFFHVFLQVSYPLPIETVILLIFIAYMSFPGFVDFIYGRWKSKIEAAIPRMLTDITSSVRTGLSLVRAFELAADRDYGPLTDELKIMRSQLSWGIPFEEVMRSAARRIDTLIARRTFILFMEAGRGGGKIEELLDAMKNHVVELYNIEKERKATLRPYIIITYIAFGVFLAIAWVLVSQFFSSVLSLKIKSSTAGASVFSGLGGLDLPSIKSVFFQMALIEAVFGGLGAGKLGEASFSAGFKHIIILVILTVIVFEFWIG